MTSPVMPPADHAVREEALDPSRSFIVEAPAGSGKTELLTRRYLRLLACVQSPEDILAITFTRKAAAEMRTRVLKALTLAASTTQPDNPMEQALWRLACDVRDADAQHGWHLLSHPSRLRIMTIDALNSSLAKQLPILSGTGATLSIARDTQALYAEVVLRLVERLGDRDTAADTIARLLRHLDNRYERLDLLLAQELARREHWLDLGLLRFDLPTLRVHLEQALSATVAHELSLLKALIPADAHEELVALVTHAAAVLNGMGEDSAITACDSLTDLPAASGDGLSQWRGIAALLLTKDGEWRKKPNKNQGFPPDNKLAKQRVEALLARLQREPTLPAALHRTRQLPASHYSDAQWQILTDLLTVLKLAIAELEVVMRERGDADYVANSIAARRALGTVNEPTDLAMRLDYRLQHLLVDEFQDTSHGQVELLALLTAGWSDGDGRTLFCVGDPMQSIYRFRHADVGLFLNLKRYGLNQLRLTPLRLTVNFRSTKPVLDWVNRTFAHALPQHDDAEHGAVAFTASEPRANAGHEGGVFVHGIIGDKVSARSEEARQIAALIKQTLHDHPAASIAVLVSSRLHLKAIIRELHAQSIAFQAVDIDPLVKRPVIQDLIALTRALVHLADRSAWLAVLRAPWCGLSLADLHTLSTADDARDTLWQRIETVVDAPSSLLSKDGQQRVARVLPILRRAVTSRGRINLRDCVEQAWHALGGPATIAGAAALQDSAAYFDRLNSIERNGDIEDIARLEHSLRDLYANADVTATASVELMTIHRAKGLEFDVVILPALDSGSRNDDPPLLRAQELPQLTGERALLLAPIAPSGSDKDSIYAWLELLDKERAKFEKGRLLYVAATRAERELHLFGALDNNNDELSKPRANTFLQLLWHSIEADFVALARVAPAMDAAANAERSIRTQRLPLSWQPPAPLESESKPLLRDVIENEPVNPEFEWVGETARHVGTLVHREIERITRTVTSALNAHTLAATLITNRSRYHTELAELGVPPHLREGAVGRVLDALNQMLSDERGRWLLAGKDVHREVDSELALSGMIGADIVNGIIDRTFLAQDGTRWIVDFKTSTHEGGGLEAFLASEVERYHPQLQRYAQLMRAYRPNEPIKAALYFPLLKVWREVL